MSRASCSVKQSGMLPMRRVSFGFHLPRRAGLFIHGGVNSQTSMAWASTSATGANLSELVERAAKQVHDALDGNEPDLLLAFVTPHFAAMHDRLPAMLRRSFGAARIAGCSAGGVIGGGEEIENRPALSLTAARLPGVALGLRYTDTTALPDEDAPPEVWRNWLGLHDHSPAGCVVLADPFTARVEPFLTGLDYAFPGLVTLGGLASGGMRAGENALFVDDDCHHGGLLALTLSGAVQVDAIVAQGCRPIGRPLVVTRCEDHRLQRVDGESPLAYLNQVFQEASESDRQLMRTSLFLGLAVEGVDGHPDAEEATYLIRNLIGADYSSGTAMVGAHLREGQVVRFFLRDRQTSQEDLTLQMDQYTARGLPPPNAGALLFSCLGRGQYLYGVPNYDSACLLGKLGERALGGFFCNGEIGPVGGSTYIHGYTSAFGIIRPRVMA
ncbi:MAG TPA: FIST N-terminal domain-containing protein [Kiritimatiellia bacterium]|nr:FIST N-terminal domain-containing protein [Kiritimatiellia bacterium]HMO99537.1 FIST N-terminal domain-containing protein [Kiritimatiellia bacterium]